MESSNTKPHAVLLSSPGMGHLIPILELGKRLVTLHNFDVTIFLVSSHTSVAESEIVESAAAMSSNLCEIIELHPPEISGLVDADAMLVTLLAVMMREIKTTFRSAIPTLKSPPTVLIVDLFGTESLPIADEIGIPKYVYVPSQAWFLALTIYTPILDKMVEGEYVDQKEPFDIPGCKSVRPEDVVDPMVYRTNQQYFEYVRMGVEIPKGDGILVNTWEELQATTLAALRNNKFLGRIAKVPVFSVGPMTRSIGLVGLKDGLHDWLDKQPSESVLYVSFGSGGTLSLEQTTELAWGLELSQQRFIWVVRTPTAKSGDGCFFSVGSGGDDMSNYLPDGFLNRTHELGVVISQWAPQLEILSHPSVGGFLSHSGWNSTLESITNGVPMIVWPLYAEQRMNAAMLTEEIGVAVRSKVLPSKEVVRREEISMMVRKIMVEKEGNSIRAKAKELKFSAEKAWNKDGSSYNALSQFAKECKRSIQRR